MKSTSKARKPEYFQLHAYQSLYPRKEAIIISCAYSLSCGQISANQTELSNQVYKWLYDQTLAPKSQALIFQLSLWIFLYQLFFVILLRQYKDLLSVIILFILHIILGTQLYAMKNIYLQKSGSRPCLETVLLICQPFGLNSSRRQLKP